MFVVLDTNHFTEFTDASVLGRRLLRRIDKQQAEVFTCIVAVEETTRGWLALLKSLQARARPTALLCFVSSKH